jgi:hypothetical protein
VHFCENRLRKTENYGQIVFIHLSSVLRPLFFDLTSIRVFPITLMLLKSMADTATKGVSRPLMAMGMLMTL